MPIPKKDNDDSNSMALANPKADKIIMGEIAKGKMYFVNIVK